MGQLHRDLRYAFRTLSRSPGFVAVAVLILALGIGLNSAVFSAVNAVLLRPLPVSAPGELVRVYSSRPDDVAGHAPLAWSDFTELRDRARSFGGKVLAFAYSPLALERGDENRLVMGEQVSAGYFSMLGVEPAVGRAFEHQAERTASRNPPPGPPEAVLSDLAWRRRFGADPGVVGSRLRLNGRTFTVVGVAPAGFSGLTWGVAPELWLPLGSLPSRSAAAGAAAAGEQTELEQTASDGRWLWVIGRLGPGVEVAEARAEIGVIAAGLWRRHPESHRDLTFVALPAGRVRILPGVDGTLRAASTAAMGVVVLVLLLASANLANLLLARGAGRRKEIATRLSLGASTGAVVRQLLTENLLLALAGGTLGLLLALGSNLLLGALRLPVPVDLDLGLAVDGRVFLFTLAASAATALAFGLAPALAAVRTDLAAALRGSAAAPGAGRRRYLRGGLVVAQVALSLMLLACAGLAVRSLQNAQRIDPGFDAEGVVVATLAPRMQGYSRSRAAALSDRLVEEVRALPGTVAAGLASHLPLTLELGSERIVAAGRAGAPEEEWLPVDAVSVGPGYFEAMAIPLRHGRAFSDADTPDAPRVAVVNETLAELLSPASAIGRRLRVAGAEDAWDVVGVAGDGKYRTLGEAPRPFLYRALAQNRGRRGAAAGAVNTGSETLVARVEGEPTAALAAIRRLARELDENLALTRLTTLEAALGPTLWLPRTGALLFGLFGAVGLALAAAGIYGVMAYATSRRTREIGIRLALGARRRDVVVLLARGALVLTAAGLGVGLAGSAVAAGALRAMLYGVAATDALTYAAVSLLLGAVAVLATYLPARRAAGADPAVALRSE